MIRKIITIDEDKCNGCGLCVDACHEGAIGLKDNKAVLLRDDYCDGLGDCLPACPSEAISFEKREAAAYDEVAVQYNMKAKNQPPAEGLQSGSLASLSNGAFACPGGRAQLLPKDTAVTDPGPAAAPAASQLRQWPLQIKLAPIKAPYFHNANLLIAADCSAFSFGDFHNRFMKNRITLIGCPKLDEGDYTEKLTAILQQNDIKSLTVTRMEVPCCGGIVNAVKNALLASGKMIPWQIVTLSTDGQVIED